MKYSVRDAVDMETYDVVDVCERVLQEAPTYSRMRFDRDKVANYVYGAIVKQPTWFLRVIVDEDNKIVGGICCQCVESMNGPDKVAFDVTIMLDEEHRGKCLKQIIQIVEEYKEWAIAEGAVVIKMGVSSGINMDKASVFFETLGFKRIGAMHGYIV